MVNSERNYSWDTNSTYIKKPPYFTKVFHKNMDNNININEANILVILGDSITTDHISPAGNIADNSPAGIYLNSQGVANKDFNSYGARRGNHEVMLRGTFANIRLQNEMTPERKSGYTVYIPTGDVMSIYDAAANYKTDKKAVVVIAGKEYGTGSSRDWAAKGTALLGVKVVIAESFERIHRSNLIGMGVLPLMFKAGQNRKSLGLDGSETIDIICGELKPGLEVKCNINRRDSNKETIYLICRIDTDTELEYYASGGILHKVIKEMV
jgi:aconitate hydratase